MNLYGGQGLSNGNGYATSPIRTSNGATLQAQNGTLDLNGQSLTVACLGGDIGTGGGAYGVVTNSNATPPRR